MQLSLKRAGDEELGPDLQHFGLSPMQSGMLFQALLDDGDGPSAGYDLEQLHLRLSEVLDHSRFMRAWVLICERHPILTSSFHLEGFDEPQQLANPGAAVAVEFRSCTAAERERELQEFLLLDRQLGFDLQVAPLMRVTVFECAPGPSDVIWSFHHILLDGRSFAPVLREVFELYDDLRQAEPPRRISPRARPYPDFIRWLDSQDPQASLDYFHALLAGKSAPTPLPCAEPAARPLDARGYGELVRTLDAEDVLSARELAAQTGSTLGTIVQAAWALVLARHTGDKDVLFGATRSGRRSALNGEAEHMVGLIMNTLPVRADVANLRTVHDLLTSLRAQSLALREHEHTSLVAIHKQSEFGPGAPLFETLLMFENKGLCEELKRSGSPRWQACQFALHEQPSLPLTITVYDGQDFELRALFDRRRFRPSTIERLLRAFGVALRELSFGAQRSLAELCVLSEDETRAILFGWNETDRAYPHDACIHDGFEAQVARTPDAPAVEVDDERVTYRELDELSNRLAHRLRAHGIGPGVYVGVCFSRGLELIVGLLGVAKSGAAYVPLDPDYPRDRLSFMVQDTAAPLVVTEQRYRDSFAGPTLVLDAEGAEEVRAMPATRPARIGSASDVCYAIFTSGSTGIPKGVVLSHRAVVNTFDWVGREFRFGPSDRLLFVTSPCFDLSVFDIFGVLGTGGTVVVATSELLRDPERLAQAIVLRKITVWDSAPAALQRLVPFFAEQSQSFTLRLVMLSGDWIPLSLPDSIRQVFPVAEAMSLGGATEAAIWSNWFPIGSIDPRWTSIPYGRPIQNSRYHVLDERLEPVPVGVAGDLYIGGACLANEYLNREELTRERFIADPFRPGERLYKTGDLARYFDDGNLEFLGRADFQVKIRGFRVEIGEVEAVLASLPGVREAICAAVVDASGQKSLVAYILTEDGAAPTEESLKASASVKLPDFMVPSHIMRLDAFPMSRNGKLDRSALPSPATKVLRESFVAPRTELERGMTALWETLLDRKPIGVRDDFYKLGGHSLLAVLLISRIKSELGIQVPLSRMIEHPTIESLVQSIAGPKGVPDRSHVVTLCGRGASPPLFLLPGAGGYSFIYRSLPVLLGEDQPVYALQAIGAESAADVDELSIEQMADIYLPELLKVRPKGPYLLAGYSFGVLVAFELAHRLRKLGHAVPLLISLDGFAPGFPRLMPLGSRLIAHGRAFAASDMAGRRSYLGYRFRNLLRRVLTRIGRAHELIEDIPFADAEMNDRMRKLWASYWTARTHYRPSHHEPCELLLVKTTERQNWIGNQMDDPLYGWRSFVSGAISVVDIEGQHLQLFAVENQSTIARAISKHIAGSPVVEART